MLTVLVTRPNPEGQLLCEKIRELGSVAVYFPVIEIIPVPNQFNLHGFDLIIFNSPQAVYQSKLQNLSKDVQIAAIGNGTANALKKQGLRVDLCPVANWSSEGLLELPEFQEIKGKRIAIVKGQGGRELLKTELISRGAAVEELIVYRRALPEVTEGWAKVLHNKAINVIICTSNEGLQNLKKLLISVWDQLKKTDLIVISQRMHKEAQTLGFEKIIVADNAGDEAVLKTLKSLDINHDR